MAEKFAADFITRLNLSRESDQKCEWSCILWSKDHWASEAQRAQIGLQQAKDRLHSTDESATLGSLFRNSQFLNTVAQVYSKLFDVSQRTCSVKTFSKCPFINEREGLLTSGTLASIFVTILHKAALYSMLEDHPIDSGLLDEEYHDVYGINMTDFRDLERSLQDGRFGRLFENTVKRARQLAGLPQPPSI